MAASQKTASSKVEFNRDIRPILTENCFACHGTDSASRKASLRLDLFEDATASRKNAKPAIVPGKPDDSELIARIMTTDEDDIMPPPGSHKVLTVEQKELLKRWIAEGAKYQEHWSLLAASRSETPRVKNKQWVKTPIDAFILARLEAEGLKPAPEADRRTLARRLSLDLIGLPPQSGEVEAFVKDKSADAYEKYVDKLLASPHWGEHRGRYWLDAARYADTHGIHFDNYREMWSYRDWVINALNKNMSFDQFTIEQLAGDLLPKATLEQKVATGFNRNNITSNEGGIIDEEYYVLYTRDRTETAAQVWLGLTAGCAVCHDHKYDRFSQKEFFELSAFFNNSTQSARDGNIKDTPPIITVPTKQDRARWDVLPADKKLAQTRVDDRKKAGQGDFEKWIAKGPIDKISDRLPAGLSFHAPLSDNKDSLAVTVGSEERTITISTNATWQDGAIAEKAFTTSREVLPEIADAGDFERDQKFTVAAWVKLAPDNNSGALIARMDDPGTYRGWDLWFEGGKPGTHIIHNWPDDAIKVVSRKTLEANRWTHVCITYDGSSKASGVKIYIDGESQRFDVPKDALKNSIRTEVPLKIGQRSKEAPLQKAGIQDVRFYSRVLKITEARELSNAARMAWLVSKPADQRDDAEKQELYSRYLSSFDREYQDATAHVAKLEKEESEIKSRGTIAHISQEKETPAEAYILFRGEYDKRRDKVFADTPDTLPPFPADFPRNRLGFAKWLLLPENPLTARVTVNRFWQELFGNGLVKTPGDFGVSGEMPSHPELLDWMAIEFRENGWDMKKFYKLLVTSATYRQAATLTPEKLNKDPENILLARGPRFRMDAEMVRDYALSSSGLLVAKLGGPSVRPYQPEGVWEAVAMPESNTRIYKEDSGENLYRRSVYTFWKRAAPPASMDVFNAPNRETCAVKRERTNTPLQALATLNDTQFVEAARNLAERALKDFKENERIDYMAKQLLARSLRGDEKKITESVLKELLAHYKGAPADAEALVKVGESEADASLDKPTLAAYTMVANQLMNLDEVLNK
ncbi:MAG: DUF1553 domain-containing protein [Verrucomicrobia bacterium]|nr:DUF1553 domain-containing protein [Verrucomicrobiota bacterium]